MMRRRKLTLLILGVLILVMLMAVTTANAQLFRRKKQDFGGRAIRWATWWYSGPEPGRSEREDLRLKREAEVGKKYNVKFEYVNVPGASLWPNTSPP